MLMTNAVTVAIAVPVYLTSDDIVHMQQELGFAIPLGAVQEYVQQTEGGVEEEETGPPSPGHPSLSRWIKKIHGHNFITYDRTPQEMRNLNPYKSLILGG